MWIHLRSNLPMCLDRPYAELLCSLARIEPALSAAYLDAIDASRFGDERFYWTDALLGWIDSTLAAPALPNSNMRG